MKEMGIERRYVRNKVTHKLVRRVHGVLEEIDHNRIETFAKSRIPSERLL